MIIQEFKYQYAWGVTNEEEADVILHYKYEGQRAQFFVSIHDGTTLESDTFTVVDYSDIFKYLTVFMNEFVEDFDAGNYNI